MKKTSFIELFANIKKTFISFISITMFVFLGVGVFLGFSFSGMSMKDSLNNASIEANAHDISISYQYGITKEEANEFLKFEDVDEVDLQFKVYESFKYDNATCQAAIISYTDTIDTFSLVEGRLPSKENEILIEKGSSSNVGLEIGDTITFEGGNGKSNGLLNIFRNYDPDNFEETLDLLNKEYKNLKYDTYTIVGVVEHPQYYSNSLASYGVNDEGLQIRAVFFLSYDAFNEDVASNAYTTLLLKSDTLDNLLCYEDDFEKQNIVLRNEVKEYAEALGNKSYTRVRNNIDSFLEEADKKLNAGREEISEGLKKIDDAEIEISENEDKLSDAKIKLENAKKELATALEKIKNAEVEIANAKEEIESKQSELKFAKAVLSEFTGNYDLIFLTFDEYISNIKESPSEDEVRNTIETIDALRDSYSTELALALATYNVELTSDLDDQTNTFVNDLSALEYDYMYDVIDDYIAKESDDATKIIKDVDSKVKAGTITHKEAIEELNKEYENDESVYDFVLNKVCNDEKYEVKVNATDYKNRANKLETTAKVLTDNYLIVIDAYLKNAETEINEANKQLKAAEETLANGKEEYNEKYNQYLDGLKQYTSGLQELSDAKDKVNDAKVEIDDASKEIEEVTNTYDELVEKVSVIKDYGTNVQIRNENTISVYIKLLSDIVIKLKYSLGGLFLIISIMVCYSVVTRNVNNQIKEIGTKKALGLYDSEITISCLAYSLMSVIIGSILGLFLSIGIEKILVPSVKAAFNFEMTANYFSFTEFILIVVLEFILMGVVTYIGCRNILKQDAVTLLQGKQVKKSNNGLFEKFKIWNKLSLLNKTIVNNCLNDPMRVIATLVGIAGCTALVVSSITLKDNVTKSFDKQYADYFNFESLVYFDRDNNEARQEIEKYFDEHNIIYANAYRSLVSIELNGENKSVGYEMIYEDNENFRKLVKFDGVNSEFAYKGIWIPESYEKYYGLSDNESFVFTDSNGESYDTYINGYYKYYSYILQVYIDSNTYEELTASDYKPNIYLIDLNGNDYNTVANDLSSIEGFTSMMDYYNYCRKDVNVFASISTVLVGIYLVISTLMSIFVLLNLYATFIDEKKKELIVLMINGYSIKEAKRYIYSDTIFLTIVGVIIGVFVGIASGNLSIGSFEGSTIYLMHNVDIFACVVGVAVTCLLSYIMCKIALRKITSFDLTDINKA